MRRDVESRLAALEKHFEPTGDTPLEVMFPDLTPDQIDTVAERAIHACMAVAGRLGVAVYELANRSDRDLIDAVVGLSMADTIERLRRGQPLPEIDADDFLARARSIP